MPASKRSLRKEKRKEMIRAVMREMMPRLSGQVNQRKQGGFWASLSLQMS